MSDTDLMTTHEVAEYLRCGYRKALSLMGNEIPAALGRGWTARRADVEAYHASQTVTDRSSKSRSRGRGRRGGRAA